MWGRGAEKTPPALVGGRWAGSGPCAGLVCPPRGGLPGFVPQAAGAVGAAGPAWRGPDAEADGPDPGRRWRNKGCRGLARLLVRSPSPVPVGHTWCQTTPRERAEGLRLRVGGAGGAPDVSGTGLGRGPCPPTGISNPQRAGRQEGRPGSLLPSGAQTPREDPSFSSLGLSNNYICVVIPFLFFKIVFHYFRPALY